MNEDKLSQLELEVQRLRNIIEKFAKNDRYIFERTTYFNLDKIGFFGNTPIKQQTSGSGATGYMTTPGGSNVQENSEFYGNLAYYNGGGGTKYTIPDIVTTLKDYGLLKD